jgi:hypothetical protein
MAGMREQSYEAWKRLVDAEIQRRTGMTADDIDDWRYTRDFDEGVSAKRSAARAIKNAKEACGL